MIDIYHSRRTKYERCCYYTEEPDRNLEQWVLTAKVSGIFYAQPVNNRINQENQISNVVILDKNIITLLTSDEVDELKRGCVVLYRGHPWIVDNLTKELHLKESEFGQNHYETYINMRR